MAEEKLPAAIQSASAAPDVGGNLVETTPIEHRAVAIRPASDDPNAQRAGEDGGTYKDHQGVPRFVAPGDVVPEGWEPVSSGSGSSSSSSSSSGASGKGVKSPPEDK